MQPLGPGDPIRLGPYRLLGVLGAGGMGRVYLGRDGSGRTAAVKVLHPGLTNDLNLTQRFVREAEAAQAVTSPGVARLLAAQTEARRLWISTEFLAGPTLDSAVERHGPFDERALRHLAHSLAHTLCDIHRAGLIHRDIKPSNIILTRTGPRIIDFGIARPEHGLTLTTTGQAPATPGYGAPEQVLGQRVDPSADVFSLGAVLAYAASGRRVFDGAHVAAVQYEVVHGQPRLDAVPWQFRSLIEPCLSKAPGNRPRPEHIAQAFATRRGDEKSWRTGALASDIKERETEVNRFVTAVGPRAGQQPSRRRFLVASLSAGGAVLAAAGGTTAWWLNHIAGGPVAIPPDAEPVANQEYADGRTPRPLWGPLNVAAEGPVPPPIAMHGVVIFSARDGGLAAHKAVDGEEVWNLSEASGTAGMLQLSETHFIAVTDGGEVASLDASTGEQQWAASAEAVQLLALDETCVYVLTRAEEIRAVEISGRKPLWTVTAPEGMQSADRPLAAAGAERLVVSGSNGVVIALSTDTGREVWRRSQGFGPAMPAIDRSSVYLGGRELAALMVADGTERWTVSGYTSSAADGWGAPWVKELNVCAIVGGRPQAVRMSNGDTDLMGNDSMEADVLSSLPPVAEGRSLLVDGAEGVSVFYDPPSRRAWVYKSDTGAPTVMAGAGRRVFLVSDGNVTAVPVL
ncbi:protein kinase domain-containing protein [Streptomyces sp. NPDC054847]